MNASCLGLLYLKPTREDRETSKGCWGRWQGRGPAGESAIWETPRGLGCLQSRDLWNLIIQRTLLYNLTNYPDGDKVNDQKMTQQAPFWVSEFGTQGRNTVLTHHQGRCDQHVPKSENECPESQRLSHLKWSHSTHWNSDVSLLCPVTFNSHSSQGAIPVTLSCYIKSGSLPEILLQKQLEFFSDSSPGFLRKEK